MDWKWANYQETIDCEMVRIYNGELVITFVDCLRVWLFCWAISALTAANPMCLIRSDHWESEGCLDCSVCSTSTEPKISGRGCIVWLPHNFPERYVVKDVVETEECEVEINDLDG